MIPQSTPLSKSGIKSLYNFFFSKTYKLRGAVVALSRKHKKNIVYQQLSQEKNHQPSKFNKKS